MWNCEEVNDFQLYLHRNVEIKVEKQQCGRLKEKWKWNQTHSKLHHPGRHFAESRFTSEVVVQEKSKQRFKVFDSSCRCEDDLDAAATCWAWQVLAVLEGPNNNLLLIEKRSFVCLCLTQHSGLCLPAGGSVSAQPEQTDIQTDYTHTGVSSELHLHTTHPFDFTMTPFRSLPQHCHIPDWPLQWDHIWRISEMTEKRKT